MESLDITILNTAVPTIANAFGVAPLGLKSALTSYTLSLAVFIPLSGWLADRFGTRSVFASAIGLFTLGSLLCGLSPNLTCLVAARILQGMGGAMMMPVGRIAIVRTFPKEEILRAMSFVLVPGLVGPLIGPLVGGLIVGLFHWRVIFLVNVPIGLLGLWIAHRNMPDYQSNVRKPLDLVGFILFGAGIATLSYVLEIFGHHSLDWGKPPGSLRCLWRCCVVMYGMRRIPRIPFSSWDYFVSGRSGCPWQEASFLASASVECLFFCHSSIRSASAKRRSMPRCSSCRNPWPQ